MATLLLGTMPNWHLTSEVPWTFCLLGEGVYILLGDNITPDLLVLARELLSTFYKDHQVLYGDGNCSLNVHNVGAHFVTYVQSWGPLWAWSWFPFEDLNGALLESVHGTGNQCRQLTWMLYAQNSLRANCHLIPDKKIQLFVEKEVNSQKKYLWTSVIITWLKTYWHTCLSGS